MIIDDEQRKHFKDGKILIATNGFLRWGLKIEKIMCSKAFWFEKMKLPELPPAPKAED